MKRVPFASPLASAPLLLPRATFNFHAPAPRFIKAFAFSLLAMLAHPAFAACQANSMIVTLPSPLTFSGPADANPLGAQIGGWSGQVADKRAFDIANCPGWTANAVPQDAPINGLTHQSDGESYPVYPTGIPGVGYVIGIKDPNASNWISVAPPQTQTYPAPGTTTGGGQTSLGFTTQIKLIATGPVPSGTHFFAPRVVAKMIALDGNKKPVATPLSLTLGAFTVEAKSRGCKVVQGGNQAITLPTVATYAFKGVGSTVGASNRFTIGIACDQDVAVYATMTDVSNPSNTGNTLSLGPDSSAAGVGLRLYKRDETQPIMYGPDSSRKGNVNQWLVGNTASGAQIFTIPFEVKYVQTDAKISPGSVKAKSSITFSYQ
ncbi:fimbrial protein [Burkholderia seminalis]|uniref:fimbrial protein n=1 Tax=Burkholderia seminalis TaxID=488731 RepID=UPI001453095E|nr:fimbrial protein [Burkholderia seminalis]VWC39541.1 type-1 fimbrial protein subunit A [Burkholderia seminalis]